MRRSYHLNTAALTRARISATSPICLSSDSWGREFSLLDEAPTSATPINSVAIVTVYGALAKDADEYCGWTDGYGGEHGLVSRFGRAASSPDVGAIVLKIGSPGGTSEGLEEAIAAMQKSASGKHVFAWFDEFCCSAAYWIAATVATAGIYLPQSGFAGSIGCYCAHVDVSAALEAAGEKWTIIEDPPGKTAITSIAPLGDMGRERLNRDVSQVTARFKSAVSAARGIGQDKLAALKGDVLPAPEAVAFGLCDGILSFDGVVSLATQAANKTRQNMELSRITQALGLKPEATIDEAVGAIGALVQTKARVSKLETELAQHQAKADESERYAILTAAIASGKIVPSVAYETVDTADGAGKRVLTAWASPPHSGPNGQPMGQSVEQLKAFLDAMPATASAPSAPKQVNTGSDEDERLAQQCGMSVDDYRKTRAAVRAEAEKSRS